MPTIDSSTIISFAKIQKLDLLKLLKTKIETIEEVYEECVKKGINLGYADAIKIKKIFDEKIIMISNIKKYEEFSGVSKIDSKVINFAKEKKDYLFVDDVKLGRRAKAENIEVRNAPDILLHLTKTNRLTKEEFNELLQKLIQQKRLSLKSKKLYEEIGGSQKNGKSNQS
ncbi:MAG: hypothetical protein AABW58_00840 [Nanoarchaeota archaeon]